LVVEVIRPGVYRLQEINDTTFPNVWNIKKLRKFYPSLLSFTFFFSSLSFFGHEEDDWLCEIT
jgi:hypothetical protein